MLTAKISFTPAVGTRTYERIVEQVEDALMTGKLGSGDHLPSEREMMEQFGVSRSTVREALRVLESRGLVFLRPGGRSGPRIIQPSPEIVERDLVQIVRLGGSKVSDLVHLRMSLDGTACSIAAHLADSSDIAELHGLLGVMEKHVNGDAIEFARADAALHEAIRQLTGNELLVAIGQAVRESIVQMIATDIRLDGSQGPDAGAAKARMSARDTDADLQHSSQDSLSRDRVLVALIEKGDSAGASAWMRRCLWERFADQVSTEEAETLRALVS